MLELGAAAVERERLRFGGGDLGRGARHVELGDVAGAPAPLGQRERFAVGDQGTPYQSALIVERAQREVGLRDLGLDQQARALQQRFARLRIERGGVAGVRQAAEEIDLIGQVGAGEEQVARRAVVAADEALRALGARADADLQRAVGIGDAHEGARLAQARRRDLDAGVALARALDEAVEHRVVERLPPLAARLRRGRRRDGPVLLELGRHRRELLLLDLRAARWRSRRGAQRNQGQSTFFLIFIVLVRVLLDRRGGKRPAAPPPKASASCGISPWCLSGRLPVRARSST